MQCCWWEKIVDLVKGPLLVEEVGGVRFVWYPHRIEVTNTRAGAAVYVRIKLESTLEYEQAGKPATWKKYGVDEWMSLAPGVTVIDFWHHVAELSLAEVTVGGETRAMSLPIEQ